MIHQVQFDDRFLIGQQIPLTSSFTNNMNLIQTFWRQFNNTLKKEHLTQGGSFQKYGITFRKQQQLYYACAVPTLHTYPKSFQLYQLPRHVYLHYEHIGPMTALPQTIHTIMKEYLPSHGYQCAPMELIYYEQYQESFQWNQETSIITIGVPLQLPYAFTSSIPAKTILQGNGLCPEQWNWFGMDYNMNLYKGCSHGCIYCDSRSRCYQVEDFDLVRTKQDELTTLELELKRKKRKGVVGIGAMSDTYNPLEKEKGITRGALRLLSQYGYGVGLDTKSDLILRDLPLLQEISKHYPSIVKVTITTADDQLCKIIEPNVVSSSRRFEVLQQLHEAGIFAGILLMPILPFINDTPENIKEIVYQAHLHHAKFIYPGFGVTLRDNQRAYYYNCLDTYFPGKRELYERHYHNAYSCDSLQRTKLYQLFCEECQRYGILYRMKDIVSAYKRKPLQQLSFLP